ncbi:hypothetical protein ACFQ4C_21475 [Larkinella insperata]|uniref:DUF7674 domain-containing protein n=1 Tax=Larkinella insperata TaxID=332158 RepID=A0ABW3QL16_9BACT
MNHEISSETLLALLADRFPEARQDFQQMPEQTSVTAILSTLFDVTATLISQHKSKAVQQCLRIADELLTHGDAQIRTAVSGLYLYRLSTVLYKKDAQSRFVFLVLPVGLRSEFARHTYPDE